jgi:hypothetical protein
MNAYLVGAVTVIIFLSVCIGTVLYFNYGYQYLVDINRTECWNVMCVDLIQGCMLYDDPDSCCACHLKPHLGGTP